MNMNQGEIIIRESPSEVTLTAAELFAKTARESVSEKGFFTVAVSGGFTPRPMHRMLAKEPFRSDVPWHKTHLFWVDERCVPFEDPASNYGAAQKDFLEEIPLPARQTYPMPVEIPPEEGALNYQDTMGSFFQLENQEFPYFDLIFLGLGTDGHIAALFPGQIALEEEERFVVAVKGGNPYVNRLTMTLPALNRARQIVFLVFGKRKAETLRRVFEGPQARLPAQKIQPLNGALTWLLDSESASMLSKERSHEKY